MCVLALKQEFPSEGWRVDYRLFATLTARLIDERAVTALHTPIFPTKL